MESEKNKKIFNIAMVAIIAVIIIGGIVGVGTVKGWFGGGENVVADADKVVGIVSVERSGVSYELKTGDGLQPKDKIVVNDKAGVVIKAGENTFELAEGSAVVINDLKDNKFAMRLDVGEVFATLHDGASFGEIIANDGTVITADGTVFSVNVHDGSLGINVFEGDVKAVKGKSEATASAGQTISVVGDELSAADLMAESLNEFNINKLLETKGHKLCFTEDKLNKVLDDRAAAKAEAEQNAIDETNEGNGGANNVTSGKGDKNETAGNSGSSGSGSSSSGNSGSNSNSGSSGSSGSNPATKPSSDMTCTIQIRCDTILNNMGSLTPGKEGYVPSNGIILRTTTVSFKEGETVYDVLSRVCSSHGIQMEASFTPMYNSYYVEGINHLYELDCGDQSGWMYKVNGWFPNYGCSAYYLEDGDSIVWTYSCNGLGADVGGGF